MTLKSKVLVYEINNLSDARYCAGMGVDMLGFCINKESEKFQTPEKIKEMISWVSGSAIVLETGVLNTESLDAIELIQPDYLLISQEDYKNSNQNITQIPIIQKLQIGASFYGNIENHLIEDADLYLLENNSLDSTSSIHNELMALCKKKNIILGFGIHPDTIDSIIEDIKPSAIALKGGKEISPGLKSFDELADILEILEILD
jgi:phosphoribosylanthranilate isomerase